MPEPTTLTPSRFRRCEICGRMKFKCPLWHSPEEMMEHAKRLGREAARKSRVTLPEEKTDA